MYSIEQIFGMVEAAIKGVTTTSTLGTTLLEPQQFERFVKIMQYKTTVLPKARLQVMTSNKADIDRIGFSSRVMGVPPTEGLSKDVADFVSPTSARHQLESVYMQGVVSLTDQLLRRTIERGNLKDTIMDMIAERVGLDVEDQGINGDSGSSDPFLALNDGWLKKTRRRVVEDALKAYDDVSTPSFATGVGVTTATVYYGKVPISGGTFEIYTTSTSGTLVADEDGDGVIDEVGGSGIGGTIDYDSGKIVLTGLTASTSYFVKYTAVAFDNTTDSWVEDMFDLMIRVLPKQYYNDPSQWYINVPYEVIKAYRSRLKARYTDLGDQVQQQGKVILPYDGLWVQYVPNMPFNRGWLTNFDNTIYGVFHEIEIEQEREAKAKRYDIIVDAETDYQFEEPEATVVAELS